MTCSSCTQRKARRACPALAQTICSVCCGTKRLAEIQCPPDCVHLAAAREHPAAVVRRQQEHDIALVLPTVNQLSRAQFELFFLLQGVIVRHRPDELAGLVDDDVADAAAAMVATYETAANGVLYDHAPESAAARRLVVDIKEVLGEVGKHRGASFEADAVPVLRSIERGAREMRSAAQGGARAYLLTIERLLREVVQGSPQGPAHGPAKPSSLIVP